MIENFCLGTRRLELFSPRGRVRKGWVGVGYEDLNVALSPRLTVTPDIAVVDQLEAQAEGMDISDSNEDKAEDFDSERYGMYLSRLRDGLGRYVLPHSDGESTRSHGIVLGTSQLVLRPSRHRGTTTQDATKIR